MPRYSLLVEYEGTCFLGWQAQKLTSTIPVRRGQEVRQGVQSVLEAAVFAFCGENIKTYAAGRTDSGVHAIGQIVHLDLQKEWPCAKVQGALNFHLSRFRVSVREVKCVADAFHARFDALSRTYLYRLYDQRARLALHENRVWRVPVKLNMHNMQKAAYALCGEHDFTTFRDRECQSPSPIRCLNKIEMERIEGGLFSAEIHIHVQARSFLHKQVRSMIGSLVEVGRGKWKVEDIDKALQARDRTACGPVAPPDGLYLMAVEYPQ